MLDVCLLGTGGMMPLPNRRLTAMMARYNGKNILIDCGEGTQVAIKEKGWTFKPIDIICFTHFHADHISGLPGLLLTMGNAERTEPLLIVGPKGLQRVVEALRVIAPELHFPIEYRELNDKKETIERIGYRIEAFKVSHNVSCYGYSIVIDRQGKFDPQKAQSLNLSVQLWGKLQKGEKVSNGERDVFPEEVMGPPRKGIKVTYCTDSRPTNSIVEAARGADLLICEGMYGEQEKIGKAKEYKHMTFIEAAEIAKKAEPKELWLTHYSPSLFRPEEYMDDVHEIFQNAKPGKDLKSKTFEFQGG